MIRFANPSSTDQFAESFKEKLDVLFDERLDLFKCLEVLKFGVGVVVSCKAGTDVYVNCVRRERIPGRKTTACERDIG